MRTTSPVAARFQRVDHRNDSEERHVENMPPRMGGLPVGRLVLAAVLLFFESLAPTASRADDSIAKTANEVNKRMVKLYGAGGLKGLHSYGTGVIVSQQGHVLTAASHILATQDLRVHLYDGRRYHAKVLVVEAELDAALVKIEGDNVGDLPFFDVSKMAKAPPAQAGDWILAFSNQFQIATRDEPMSVLHGVVASYSKLQGRRGIFEAPFTGEVYVLDAITNNAGAAGGALTSRKGELLGIIGKELRNTLSETWVNYAVPIQVYCQPHPGRNGSFIELAIQGKWTILERTRREGGGGFHGIVMVPNVVQRTPPFIEEVVPNSPASRAGLKPDDLLIYVDGEQVASVKAFNDLMARGQPGAKMKLEVRRADKEAGGGDKLISIELVLEKNPEPKTTPKKP